MSHPRDRDQASHMGPYQPAMSFTEIGQRLGISRALAWHHYVSALHKLRRHPEILARLRGLCDGLERERDKRCRA